MHIYQSQLEGKVVEIIEQDVASLGYELVRVRLIGTIKRRTLQIMIERLDGAAIRVVDCEKISRHVSVMLDVEDPLEGKYLLEVSSVGLDRPLTKPKHLQAVIGQKIKLSTMLPINEQKNFTGILTAVDSEQISLKQDGHDKDTIIDISNISEANLALPDASSKLKTKPKKNKK